MNRIIKALLVRLKRNIVVEDDKNGVVDDTLTHPASSLTRSPKARVCKLQGLLSSFTAQTLRDPAEKRIEDIDSVLPTEGIFFY
ncbi:hypothetical protein M0804_009843 [Polistes exclamans]|nr:hypothetical protein M0804_009843 [Polistes exclamans]